MNLQDKYPYYAVLFQHLSSLLTYSRVGFEESIEELFMIHDLVNDHFTNLHELSLDSLRKLNVFKNEAIKYMNENQFWRCPEFVYLDVEWLSLLKDFLIPALESIELDFDRHGLQYISFKDVYNSEVRPSDKEILERVQVLFDLLLGNGIIEKIEL